MISIIKYLNESDVHDVDTSGQGIFTHAAKYWTGLRTKRDTTQSYHDAEAEGAKKLAAERLKHAKELEIRGPGAAALSDETSGSEAAGHAMKKGAQAAGEAVGSLGKKAAEFAGEHGTTAGVLGGAALAALAMRRKKNQQQ